MGGGFCRGAGPRSDRHHLASRLGHARREVRSATGASALRERNRAENEAELARRAEASALTERARAQNEADSARCAEASAVNERKRAESEADVAKAVKEFLNNDVLAQASTYSQFQLNTVPDRDLKVRTALDCAAEHIGDRFAGRPLVEAAIRQAIGGTYLELGLYPAARPHLERSLELFRGARGDEDPDVLNAMRSLGYLDFADGKWNEAPKLLIPAMEGLKRVRGSDHIDTLTAMASLVEVYVNQQTNLSEAESLISHVRDVLIRTRGAKDIKALDATNSLAMVLQAQNKSDQAEGLLKNAVQELQAQMTVDHPLTLITMFSLAQTYVALGKKVDAKRCWTDVLARQRRVLGDKHPHTLLTMVELALLLLNLRERDEAEHLFLEAIAGCRVALDRNHETAAGALSGLGSIYSEKQDLTKLGPVLIELRDITSLRYGRDTQVTADGNQAVGSYFLTLKDLSRAEPFFRDCLTFWTSTRPDHANRFRNELRLGVCLLGQKKFAEAKSRLRLAYDGLKPRNAKAISADASDLGRIIDQLMQLRDESGQLVNDLSLTKLRGDPTLRAIYYDFKFPAVPFAH